MLSRSLHFIPIFFLSISGSLKTSLSLLPFQFAYLCLLFPISVSPHPSTLSLTHTHIASFTSTVSFFHFTSFFPAPSAAPLFRSLRKSHSLIWDMLDLVSLKATLLTPCLPLLRTAQAILNSFTIRQALSTGMLLIGQLFTPNGLLMLILYLPLHLLDFSPPLPSLFLPPLLFCSSADQNA